MCDPFLFASHGVCSIEDPFFPNENEYAHVMVDGPHAHCPDLSDRPEISNNFRIWSMTWK